MSPDVLRIFIYP